MQGEVYVPYTQIGGTNMDSGIMMANIGGSSGQYDRETGELISTVSVRWNLPGGIINKTDGTINPTDGTVDGLWGYLVSIAGKDGAHICHDSDVIQHLEAEGINDPINNPNSVDILNKWIREYVSRVLAHSVDGGHYDYNRFKSVFEGCLAFA